VLGDNVFHGHGLTEIVRKAATIASGARVFAYYVSDPERYGVVDFDAAGKVLSLEEKPAKPKSNFAVPGIYFYGTDVVAMARSLKPSARGELEITDLNRLYLQRGDLTVEKMGRGIAWLDAGTARSLLESSTFIGAIEERQGLKVACLEEIAWRNGWITLDALKGLADRMGKSAYATYLRGLIANPG
jgi:glucose-1-phosphate thymidylyltransferase